MIYTAYYGSPLGKMLLAAKEEALIGLWLEGQKYYLSKLKEEMIQDEKAAALIQAGNWLDRYFAGEKPKSDELPLAPKGSGFQQTVWDILCKIPYGSTVTYGEIAKQIASERGIKQMSAQAVGGAVGHNPISIIIPCHRVVGTNGNLTGYAGGIDKKIWLLAHEKQG